MLVVLVAAAVALVVATTSDVGAQSAWTLIAALAAVYIIGRGAARGHWPPNAREHDHDAEPARAEAPPLPPAAPGPAGARAAGDVLLREEQVHVGRRERPRERVRLRKHVVVEYVEVVVPVRREELRLERVPLDAPPDPTAEADIVLMEDEPVIERRVVASETTTPNTPEETHR